MSMDEALQNKIFSRWVNQKLTKRKMEVKDVVQQMDDGLLLIALIEELSETKCTEKINPAPKMDVNKLDNLKVAIKYCLTHVPQKQPPAPDQLMNKDFKAVMGIVWAIMLRYMKFGDEEDDSSIDAKTALQLWVTQKTAGYNGVKIENMGKSFHNGLALCALVHKHRPQAFDFNSLTDADAQGNIEKAINAMEKYFLLEKYLSPADVPKLNENSMVVYIGDYYTSIAEMRKKELAAKRIGKVIKLTIENDAAKAEYNAKSSTWEATNKKNLALLEDRTIDNTMAGAKKRLADFYSFKKGDKLQLSSLQMDLHQIFNSLDLRLKHHNRPDFVPAAGRTLKDIDAAQLKLDKLEAERSVELHNELNRQIKLVKLDEVHKSRFTAISGWTVEKEAYLKKKEVSESVSAAQLQLRLLEAYTLENKKLQSDSVALLKKLGEELATEKYEHHSAIEAREKEIAARFSLLEDLAAKKKPVLEDDLAREEFKELVMLSAGQHAGAYASIASWVTEKKAYLANKENITSIAEARKELSLLDGFQIEKTRMNDTAVASLKTLGNEILAKKYETQYSSWVYPKPDEIKNRHATLDKDWADMAAASDAKHKVLEADLAREIEKERLRVEYAGLAAELERWSKEQCHDVAGAHFGFTLAQVQGYKATKDSEDAALTKNGSGQLSKATEVFNAGKNLGVSENPYSSLSLADLEKLVSNVKDAIDARTKAYEAELAHQIELDNLCKAFAAAATPFAKWMETTKESVSSSTKDVEPQLETVLKLIETQGSDSKVEACRAANKAMEDKQIVYNPHTTLTQTDIEAAWSQYEVFLGKKKVILEDAVSHKKMRGISQADWDDINTNFSLFDKNNSGNIDKKELKACLYSLGEERSKTEIEEYLKKYGDGKNMNKSGFVELMLTIVGVTDTKESTLDAFALLNHEIAGAERKPPITKQKMEIVMSEHDLTYIDKNSAKLDGGYDYVAFTTDMFSR